MAALLLSLPRLAPRLGAPLAMAPLPPSPLLASIEQPLSSLPALPFPPDAFATLQQAFASPIQFPVLYLGFVAYVGEVFAELLDVARPTSVALTAFSALLAVMMGLLLGDRSDFTESTRLDREIDALLVSEMPEEVARQWDEGRVVACDSRTFYEKENIPRVSAGLWLELVCCVALDFGGLGSYFFSRVGEFSDLLYAGELCYIDFTPCQVTLSLNSFSAINAFVINLFFDWPGWAVFAFWEEVLPFTDIIPSATLGWIFVVTPLHRSVMLKAILVHAQKSSTRRN